MGAGEAERAGIVLTGLCLLKVPLITCTESPPSAEGAGMGFVARHPTYIISVIYYNLQNAMNFTVIIN